MNKNADAFRTISEVADELDLPQHVLRYWETRFPQIKPLKRAGGRRYYRPRDIEVLRAIKHLLYQEGYTIRGVQRVLKEQIAGAVAAVTDVTDVTRDARNRSPSPCDRGRSEARSGQAAADGRSIMHPVLHLIFAQRNYSIFNRMTFQQNSCRPCGKSRQSDSIAACAALECPGNAIPHCLREGQPPAIA